MEEVKTSGQFALKVDETKDMSKTKQISFVLRYFDNESVAYTKASLCFRVLSISMLGA